MSWKSLLKLVLTTAAVGAVWWFGPWRGIAHPPGVLVSTTPRQAEISPVLLPDKAGWKLKAVAEYELRGRVLDTKRYHSGPSAELVPVDVAVGWGPMSDSRTLDALSISMGNRFFFYKWSDQPPLEESTIIRSAANNHIVAANKHVEGVISNLRRGHLVFLRGYLVDATKPGEGNWLTSRRRDDTGNGACEIFYVETAQAFESADGDFAAHAHPRSTHGFERPSVSAATAIR
jgi:hypothetical protein